MTADQFVGWTMHNTSAITAITSTRITHGDRPKNTLTPSINYFALPGGDRRWGIETVTYAVNCRAPTADAAKALARVVVDTFHGSSGTTMYGTNNGFDVARAGLRAEQGLIPEPGDEVFNAPVDVQIAYASSTVS